MTGPVPSLLSDEFQQRLARLGRRLRLRSTSPFGNRAGGRWAGGSEFHDHAPYSVGDPLRDIDWFAYARSAQLRSKRYRGDEQATVRILIDLSESTNLGTPPATPTLLAIAGALGFLALSEHCQVKIHTYPESSVTGPLYSGRGGSARGRLLRALESVRPSRLQAAPAAHFGERPPLGRALQALRAGAGRGGTLYILSDFLENPAPFQALAACSAVGHALCLVQVLSPHIWDPGTRGAWRLRDVEDGSTYEMDLGAQQLACYQRRLEQHCSRLRHWARGRRAPYHLSRCDAPFETTVLELLTHRVAPAPTLTQLMTTHPLPPFGPA